MLRVLVAVLAVSCAQAIVCPQDICDTMDCATSVQEADCATSGGSFRANGGFCGCCPTCVAALAEGDSCFSSFLLGVPSNAECAKGLMCDRITMKCVQLVASKRQVIIGGVPLQTCAQQVQTIQQGGFAMLGQYVPQCEADGSFSAKQCQGSVCFCADRNGQQIQGYQVNIGQANTQHCECARARASYTPGLLGSFEAQCDGDGSYSAKQCQGSVCYCVDEAGKQIAGYQANIGSASNMDCKCARDQATYQATGMIGRLFTCTTTGSYQRYQCSGAVCFCADEVGNMRQGSPQVNVGNIGSLQC